MSRVVGLLRSEDPVALRLNEQPPVVLRVVDQPTRLALTPAPSTLLVTDQQGPPGPAGPRGAPGDYGSIRYDEVTANTITLLPGQTKPLFLAAPVMMTNSLRGPFADFQFLDEDGKTIHARASGDSYLLRARMSVVASQASGSFTTDLSVIGSTSANAGPSSTRPRSLLKPAGTPDLVDELFQVFPGAGFAANGALLMLSASVPVVVTPQTIFVTPIEAA